MPRPGYNVAVVGATGLIGNEIVDALAARRFPIAELRLYASLQSAGDEVRCGALTARVEPLERARLAELDLVFLAAGEQVSAAWWERATQAGAVAIDTSQLFADDPQVPVVVPEVNAADLAGFAVRHLVTSPDAAAVGAAVALSPLAEAVPLARVVLTTFEPLSGAGRAGLEELQRQTIELMNGRSIDPGLFPQRTAFNLLPQVGEFLAGGATRGEQQTAAALRRLLHLPDLAVSVTRVWVPLFFGTALAANVETAVPLTAAAARDLLRVAPGVLLQDDVEARVYPTPASAVGQDATQVGRLRDDPAANVLDLWLALDNTRKGAAVNAVQIAELLIRDHL
jgi:aspartate-semialdehyde dehydrogenase